jgi:hypothetical protein
MPLTLKEIDATGQAVGGVIRDLLAPLDARLTAIEQRLNGGGPQTLADSYRGVFKQGESYKRGELCTDQGGLWFCNADTQTRPGSGPHWTLAVKSGERR